MEAAEPEAVNGARGAWKRAYLRTRVTSILKYAFQNREALPPAELELRGGAYERRNELRAAFDAVDVSGDGALDVDELRVLARSLGLETSNAQLREMMREIDTDGSGQVDFQEFAILMLRLQEQEMKDIFAMFDTVTSSRPLFARRVASPWQCGL
jgi:hypothetical protein